MGLDMYLYRRHYVKNWDYLGDAKKWTYDIRQGGQPYHGIDTGKIAYITEQAAYWRKANQIHSWFVREAQDGEDDCLEHYVSLEQLTELVQICQRILFGTDETVTKLLAQANDKAASNEEAQAYLDKAAKLSTPDLELAKELLEPQAGFFFGSQEYDEYYFQDLRETINQLLPYTKMGYDSVPTLEGFYYQSSW